MFKYKVAILPYCIVILISLSQALNNDYLLILGGGVLVFSFVFIKDKESYLIKHYLFAIALLMFLFILHAGYVINELSPLFERIDEFNKINRIK